MAQLRLNFEIISQKAEPQDKGKIDGMSDIEIEMLGGRPFDLTLVCDERDIVPAELVWPGAGTFHLSQATSR